LACHFLQRASTVAEADDVQHAMAKFFCELALIDHSMVAVRPSRIAAAAFLLALRLVPTRKQVAAGTNAWTPLLEKYAGYRETELAPTAAQMATLYMELSKNMKYRSIFGKYAKDSNSQVANHASLAKELPAIRAEFEKLV
jgi:cyclin B